MLHYFIVLNTMKSNLLECVVMQNYKVEVKNHVEGMEAQKLFFELGYKWVAGGKYNPAINEIPTIIRCHDSGCMTWSLKSELLYKDHEEVTIQELRDMVVLKRNDVGDATHTDPNTPESLNFRLFGEWWNLFTGGKWQKFSHKNSPR